MSHVHRCADYDFCYHPTEEQMELIELLSQGLKTREIAARKFLAEQTIKNRMFYLYQGMGVHTRTGLVRRALELGLISIGRKA